MTKKVIWIIVFLLFTIITLFFILNTKIVKFYYLDYKGNPNIVYVKILFLPSNESIALEKLIDAYLKFAKNSYVNSELLSYMALQSVHVVKNECFINMNMRDFNNAEFSSFSEMRSLIMLFKTILEYDKDIEIFKIDGLEKYFQHINTRFPIRLDGNNLIIIAGDVNES
jgi:hypothetical protein